MQILSFSWLVSIYYIVLVLIRRKTNYENWCVFWSIPDHTSHLNAGVCSFPQTRPPKWTQHFLASWTQLLSSQIRFVFRADFLTAFFDQSQILYTLVFSRWSWQLWQSIGLIRTLAPFTLLRFQRWLSNQVEADGDSHRWQKICWQDTWTRSTQGVD